MLRTPTSAPSGPFRACPRRLGLSCRPPSPSAASLASVLSPLLISTMAPQHHLEKTQAQPLPT